MQSLTVKDLLVPRNQYATVTADSTLRDAALALCEAQELERSLDPGRHRDRAILVVDAYNEVLGKLSKLDVLRGLLPRYGKVEGSRASSKAAARLGSARQFIDSMERDAGRWKKPLENLIEPDDRSRCPEPGTGDCGRRLQYAGAAHRHDGDRRNYPSLRRFSVCCHLGIEKGFCEPRRHPVDAVCGDGGFFGAAG